jgi:hypothetical protein
MTDSRARPQRRSLGRRTLLHVFVLGAGGLAIGACGANRPTGDVSARFAGFQAADEPNADPATVVWPPFVTRADPEIKRLYEFQLRNGELMKYMPCFCGCHLEDGHRNNRDCYVDTVNPDGTVVLDAMAPT